MNAATAKALLQNIRTQKIKQAQLDPEAYPALKGLSSIIPSTQLRDNFNFLRPTTWLPTTTPLNHELSEGVHKIVNKGLRTDATKDIITALALAGGIGAAVRGISGLQNWSGDKRISPERVVEMPVPYAVEKKKQEKIAKDDEATAKPGLGYYLPTMLLGAPLAAYGGWKGVDALFKSQQTNERERELEDAKKNYERALLGSYKTATVNALDSVFSQMQKKAFLPKFIRDIFPNLEGMTQGALITAGLTAGPLGYMLVDSAMKKNSQKAILNKAVAERARRQALNQPPEIYAVPVPKEAE